MSQHRFKRSFCADPTLSKRLFSLLEIVFPGVSRAAAVGRVLGAPWEVASTPFIRFHEDIAITHVGVLEIPMCIMGQTITVGGIHGVCTHPEFRRRGYYREVMAEVLEYCDRRYTTLVLTTLQPELYEPFGFRVVKEHVFITKCNSAGSTASWRSLNTSDPEDIKLLHRLLETRTPVSNVVGIVGEKSLFCVNEGTRPLHYIEDLDLIVCLEIEDTQLRLFDLVGTSIPTLAVLLEKIPQHIEEVVIYFSPDRLDANFQAFPHVLDEAWLMVRGAFAPENYQFMLPRSARC
ncbi:GNAT family N-acetyltransferase [Chroococcidiopsis sp. CCMEE 29]|uniref:GNAT family N-acetyltransferase n=1 Tax=Chroococcidiopsis sp. CCMEE 29 TaxID=155894 RepID=UPI002020ADAF|nr:GNAT family N-acetyltransferase [Chroococcidiopsis sp. CCMEE 29]